MTFDKTSPSRIIEADVSSQDDSMPKITTPISIFFFI